MGFRARQRAARPVLPRMGAACTAPPAEVAITQATHRILPPGDAAEPPPQANARVHQGPCRRQATARRNEHRRDFPDGRVGSHSALARPEHGEALIQAAPKCVAAELLGFPVGPVDRVSINLDRDLPRWLFINRSFALDTRKSRSIQLPHRRRGGQGGRSHSRQRYPGEPSSARLGQSAPGTRPR